MLDTIWEVSNSNADTCRFGGLQTTTFAIHDICLHNEYVQPLREELHADYAKFERTGKGLSLLDSFIKESARLTPVESSMAFISLPPRRICSVIASLSLSIRDY